MGIINITTAILLSAVKASVVLMLLAVIIVPLWIIIRANRRKKKNINSFQDNTLDIPEENKSITQGERKVLNFMLRTVEASATLIKLIITVFAILVIILVFKS